MMKDLGIKGTSYGYPMPTLMVATYNKDGSVNVMNLHWCTMNEDKHLVCCIGESKKTHENIERTGAFTVAPATKELMAQIDYLGTMTGYRVPDKFEKTGLNAIKSEYVNAPIIEGSPFVYECELAEIILTENTHAVTGKIIGFSADETVLNENGQIDTEKAEIIFFDSFSSSYVTLGEKVGKAWNEGKKYI
ncbi:MAG: flavin reductase family protein [Erysipelotrichaceae bacterium]|nr:flavin reductase family protein [Erysipelotrichaceae bacterium]